MKTNAERPADCEWELVELGQRPRSPENARKLELHLAGCETCRRQFEWDCCLADLLQDGRVVAVRGGIEHRVRALIARRRTWRWCGVSAGMAAAATLLVSGTIEWWMSDSPTSTGTPQELVAGKLETDELLTLDALTILASDPPVPTLNRPQVAWLAVLTGATEGESP